MPVSENRKRFAAWLDDVRGRAVAVAEALERTPQAVSLWKVGPTVPELALRRPLERLTGGVCPADEWETDDERAERKRLSSLRALPAKPEAA